MTLDTIGGYRLVRKLGHGDRAELFLAHPESDTALARPTAIKVYRPGVTDESVITEAHALSRAAGDHVVALRDLAMGPTGVPALVLDRVSGVSLSRLMRERPSLSPGEAITILAPLVATLTRLHSAGVVHGGIRLDAFSFDESGAPVLACFGRASLIEPLLPPVRLEAEPGASDDRSALERIANAVLERLPTPAALPHLTTSGWHGEIERFLFALGRPEPVRLTVDVPLGTVPARLVLAGAVARVPVGDMADAMVTDDGPVAQPPRFAGLTLPEWLDVPGLVDRIGSVRTALAAVRGRVWAGAAVVAVALVAAIALVPGDAPGATAEQLVAAPSDAAAPETDGPVADDGPVAGDDPVLALVVLLETRVGCIRDLSVLCLDAVDQAGSAALAYDQQLVREVQQGVSLSVPITVDAAEATLEERLGDSALVSLGDVADGEPASILLMKGEAGWRVRDYLEW